MQGDGVTVEVRGLDALERAWPAFASNGADAMGQVVQYVTGQVASETSGKVPRRTGALAGSVYPQASGGGGDQVVATVTMGRGLAYGRWIEFHGGAASGRFLIPTAHDHERDFQSEAARATNDAVKRTRWPNPKP